MVYQQHQGEEYLHVDNLRYEYGCDFHRETNSLLEDKMIGWMQNELGWNKGGDRLL